MKKSNPKALMPIGVFLVLYLGLGIVFEYVMKIPMGFYNIPIVLAFMVAILVACFQNRASVLMINCPSWHRDWQIRILLQCY